MLVETDSSDIEQSLERTVALVRSAGGFVNERLIVREEKGHFSCAVDAATPAGELLVRYDRGLSVPMHRIEWTDDSETLAIHRLPDELTDTQRALLDDWLVLVNSAQKLRRVRSSLPRFVVNSWPLRHHLAAAGHPSMRQYPDRAELKRIAINWHSGPMHDAATRHQADEKTAGMALIPLKHLVNHHPEGAIQQPVPGQVAVISGSVPGTDETFENYGDLDAMRLLLNFGFRADFAPLVHSVPVSVASPVGQISVDWVAPRGGLDGLQRDTPRVRPDTDGLHLHDLTFRPHNRDRIAVMLAMALASRSGLTASKARDLARETLDQIATANLEYYSTLDNLVVARLSQLDGRFDEPDGATQQSRVDSRSISGDMPPLPVATEREVLHNLAMVSLIQQDKIRSWWG